MNIDYTQMEDCSIEKLCPILSEVFEQDITSETLIKDLVKDDTRNIDKLQRCIISNFGVHPIVGDIISSENVLKLSIVIHNYFESPKYLMSPEDIRRHQLEEVAENNSLDIITGKLTNAGITLQNSLDNIKGVVAPTDEIGYKTEKEWMNKVLNFIDPKVSKDELVKVVSKIDKNSKDAFNNLGEAIAATNTWIDAICKALLWIIKIEDDLYDVSEESSSKLTDMSKLLSADGKNIEGLTKFGEMEKNRRKIMQQKMREFTADIEGKFDFLNDLNKDLRKKFDESLGLVGVKFDNAEKLLNEKVDSSIIKITQSQNDFISQSKEQTTQTLELIKKQQEEDLSSMQKGQKESLDRLEKHLNDSLAELKQTSDAFAKSQEEFVSQSKEQTSLALSELQKEAKQKTMEIQEQTDGFIVKISKQLIIYKVISIVALIASIISLIFKFIM